MSHISPIAQRLRLTFGKSGPLIYTSNLDVAKIWERVLRRADLPLLYTQGFNTRPRISLAMPLPLGISSECELLDIALRQRISLEPQALRQRLLDVSPPGLSISAIAEVSPRAASLHSLVTSAEYQIRFLDAIDPRRLQEEIDRVLSRDSIVIERRRRRKRSVMDARPLILDLQAPKGDGLIAHLAVGDRGNLRPDQLLELMGLEDWDHRAHRRRLHFLED